MIETQHFRSIFISDVHLGTKGCRVDDLLYLLKHTTCDYLFLIGDIIDFWALKRQPYWPTSHNTLIQKILKKARHGTKVIFIPGNHDEILREYVGMTFGEISVQMDYVHTLVDGRKFLCIHGDVFDVITRYHTWLAVLGDIAYTQLLILNRYFNKCRRLFGMKYWSLSKAIKQKVKNAVNFICEFEINVSREAALRGVDGVICGHIHHAQIKKIDDMWYLNTGDFVESCTAIVEHTNGDITLLHINTEQFEEIAKLEEVNT